MNKSTKKLVLKTSKVWQKKFEDKIVVLDPDGWDRQNFEKSWNKDKISEFEFKERCRKSTLKFLDKDFLK
jgi:hypothetical protein